jgi:hypothetical protein
MYRKRITRRLSSLPLHYQQALTPNPHPLGAKSLTIVETLTLRPHETWEALVNRACHCKNARGDLALIRDQKNAQIHLVKL